MYIRNIFLNGKFLRKECQMFYGSERRRITFAVIIFKFSLKKVSYTTEFEIDTEATLNLFKNEVKVTLLSLP